MQDIKAARFIFAFPTLPAIIHTKKVHHIYDAKNSQNVTKKVIFFLGMLCHFHYLIVHKHRKAWFSIRLRLLNRQLFSRVLMHNNIIELVLFIRSTPLYIRCKKQPKCNTNYYFFSFFPPPKPNSPPLPPT